MLLFFLRRKITTFHPFLQYFPQNLSPHTPLHRSTYFVPKPVRDVANENALVREMRLPSVGNQNFWIYVLEIFVIVGQIAGLSINFIIING